MRQRRSTFVRMRDAAPRHRRRERWATSFTRPHALVAFVAAPALAIGLAVGGFALPASADSDADGSGSQSQETQPPADAKAKSGASDEAKGSEDAGSDGASGNADSGNAGAGGSGSESAGGDAGNSGQKGSSGDSGTQSGGSGSSDSTGTKKSEGSNSGGSDAGNSGSSGNSGSADADESTSQKSNGSNGGSGDSSTGDSGKSTPKDDASKSADDEVIAPLAVTCTPDASTACLSVDVTVVNAGGGTAVPTDWTFEAQRQEGHWFLGYYWSNDDSSVYSLVSGDSKSATEARGDDERYRISLNSGPSN